MKLKLIICFLLLSGIASNIYAGGGWPKKKGKYYIKVAGWWVESSQHYTNDGELDPNLTAGLFNVNVFAEYGITDKLTAIAYVPFFSRAYQNKEIVNGEVNPSAPGEDLNSFGDSQLGIKYGLLQTGKIALAASYTIGLPLGKTGEGINESLATGDGELNHIFRMLD